MLDGGVVRLGFVGAFHVPDGFVHQFFSFINDGQAHMGDEIFGIGAEDTLKDIGGTDEFVLFEEGFA